MKNSLNLVLVCFVHILFCNSMHANEIGKLDTAYEQLQLNPNNRICQQEFFNSFPDDWESFRYMFDYMIDDSIKEGSYIPSNLYFESYEYICTYFNLSSTITLENFCEKTINICINGYWDADAINYLQMGVKAIFLDSLDCYSTCFSNIYSKHMLNVFCNTLSTYTDDNILSFWNFYLDSAVCIKQDNDVYLLTSKAIDNYPKLAKLLLQQYEKMQQGYNLTPKTIQDEKLSVSF